MRSLLVVFKQPSRLQGIKDALRLLGLHAQLERYLVDRREDASIYRRQTPQVNQGLDSDGSSRCTLGSSTTSS
jgi:hypothetical protein